MEVRIFVNTNHWAKSGDDNHSLAKRISQILDAGPDFPMRQSSGHDWDLRGNDYKLSPLDPGEAPDPNCPKHCTEYRFDYRYGTLELMEAFRLVLNHMLN